MNVADWVVITIVVAIVVFAILKIVKNKKNGKCNCGCSNGNCAGCEKLNSKDLQN